jgi:MFS family permease
MGQWKTRLGFPETRGTYGFIVVLIIDAFGSGLFIPLSILYFQVTAGFPLPVIGLTLTIATICTLPMTLVTGSLVDRFGARRVTSASQIIQAVGLLGYLSVHSVPVLFLMALLVTAGTRMFYAAHTALVVEISSSDERDRWYGLVGAIRNMGLGVGGFLAGIVLAMNDPTIYHVLISVSCACYLIAGILLLRMPESKHERSRQVTKARYGAVLQDRVFLGFLVSSVSFPLCALMLGTALPVYVTEALHAPVWIVGPLLVLTSLLIISCQTIVVRLLEPHRRTRAIASAALIWCGACGLFALALIIPRPFLISYIFLVVILYTLASLLYTPAASALVADLGPTALRGRYLATYEFSWGVAGALTPASFTILYALTPALPWIVLAVLTLASGIGVLWLEQKLPVHVIWAHKQEKE